MSLHSTHTKQLDATFVVREGQYGRQAIAHLGALHDWLPMGSLQMQMQALERACGSSRKKDQAAVLAWAGLVRGRALDHYADAGQEGGRWQHAVADAWEMWLLLRSRLGGPDIWPWQWRCAQFQAHGMLEAPPSNPEDMLFGEPSAPTRSIGMDQWQHALARMPAPQSCQEASMLAQAWPQADLPTLGMAVGALWAIAVAGRVVGVQTLEMGGAGGHEGLIFTNWNH